MEKFILGLLGSLYILFLPVFPLIILVGAFIIADTFFGVYASWKTGNSITSRKLARVISKLIVYTGAILLVFGLDVLIFSMFIDTELMVTKLGAGVLCFIEGFSIDEKIRKVNNDKGMVYYLKKFFSFLKGIKNGYNDIIN
jgi:hypothetical protein